MEARSSRRAEVLADIGLLFAALSWGVTFTVIKAALSGIDPVVMVGYRFLIGGGVLLVFLLATGRNPLVGLKHALFISAVLWLLHMPQTLGLKYTTASNSGFITGLFVLFIPIFLILVFRTRPSIWEGAASVISLTGLWILTGGMAQFNLGDALALVGAVAYALHVLLSDRYMKAGFDPYRFSCQQFMIVGALSLITSAMLGMPFGIETDTALWGVLFVALVPTLSAFVIQMHAQKITRPVKVSLIFALQPVFAAATAWTLGGEDFVLHRGAGGLLIFVALVVASLSELRRHRGKDRAV